MLIASWSSVRGETGTSSGVGFRPVVLQEQRRHSLGTLLGEVEEFCSTWLKTLLLYVKHRGPGVLPLTSPPSPNAAAGAAMVGEGEQPAPPSLRQGSAAVLRSWEGHH